ncbi:hypothetical protein [Luteibaculum oceani]|uniref:Uncharacterized protein n=1 Tax=Luteibaculum oceani TaxID=1294296 RepID=A0A5C6UZ05_9FLAO|nr:hypothetical protein [Luteibaculum oceani]TXC78652.1 hypothetical protein FRX97_08010 [Luteibaculum oceani]
MLLCIFLNPKLYAQDAYIEDPVILEAPAQMLEESNSPLQNFENQHRIYDLDESIFNEKKKRNSTPAPRKNGGNPPVPISDHLEILVVGAVVLIAVFYKKLFGQ